MSDIDELDIHLLNQLKLDSQQPLKELSQKLNKKISTLHTRIKKLEEKGIIEKYSANINMKDLGFPLVGFIMLTFDKTETKLDQEEVAMEIGKIPRIEEVHLIAGEYDILLKVRAENIEDLGIFVTKDLKEIKGVGGSRTFVSLKIVKEFKDSPFLITEIAESVDID